MRPGIRSARSRYPKILGSAWRIALIGFGVLAAAINTGNNLLYLVVSLVLATVPVSLAMSRINLRRVALELLPLPCPSAGSPFRLEVRLSNTAGWVSARSLRVLVSTTDGEIGPTAVERLLAGSQSVTAVRGRASSRGVRRILQIRLQSSFPLGLFLAERVYCVDRELLILPRTGRGELGRYSTLPLPGDGRRAAGEAGDEYEGLRRGTGEDDIRSVDWKATARQGHLMLRETAGEVARQLDLTLQTRWPGEPRQARRLFERHVADLAGSASRELNRGGRVRLSEAGTLLGFAGRNSIATLLRYLARVDATGNDGAALPAADPPIHPTQERPRNPGYPPRRTLRNSSRFALLTSLCALAAFEGVGLPVFLLLLGSIAVTARNRRLIRRSVGFQRVWHVAGLLALLSFVVDLAFIRHNPLVASLNLTAFIGLFGVCTARTSRDDAQILLISFLQLVLAAALTTELTFAMFLVIWMLCTAHGLIATTMLAHAGIPRPSPVQVAAAGRGPRYLGAALATVVGVLALAAPAYWLIPHLGTGTFRSALRGSSTSGFGETTRLGDIGRIKLDNSRVMEIEIDGPRFSDLDLRWRGVLLDRFDGKSWSRSQPGSTRLITDDHGDFYPTLTDRAARAAGVANLVQRIRLDPGSTRVLFAAATARRVRSQDFDSLEQDPDGALKLRMTPNRRVTYEVRSAPVPTEPALLRSAVGEDSAEPGNQYLELPAIDPRIGDLARQLTSGQETRYDAVLAIERWLSTQLTYTLNVNDVGLEDPLAAFLFDGMAAQCEYFATAMVVLARSAGIPARFVGGYLRGEKNRFSRHFLVRQSDAHSWVEIYFPQVGWVPFDPTPPAGRGDWQETGLTALASGLYTTVARWWDDYFVGIDLDDQFRGVLVFRELLAQVWAGAVAAIRSAETWGSILVLALLGLGLRWLVGHGVLPARIAIARRSAKVSDRAPWFYRRALALLAREGFCKRSSETASEFASRVSAAVGRAHSTHLLQLTEMYQQARFGGRPMRRAEARAILSGLRRDLRRSGIATPGG